MSRLLRGFILNGVPLGPLKFWWSSADSWFYKCQTCPKVGDSWDPRCVANVTKCKMAQGRYDEDWLEFDIRKTLLTVSLPSGPVHICILSIHLSIYLSIWSIYISQNPEHCHVFGSGLWGSNCSIQGVLGQRNFKCQQKDGSIIESKYIHVQDKLGKSSKHLFFWGGDPCDTT